MHSDIFHVEVVNNTNIKDWLTLLEKSPQYSPFVRDDYLEVTGFAAKNYILYRNGNIYMGVCIPVDKNTGMPSESVPYAPYQGLLYLNEQISYRDCHNNLEATEFMLDYLYSESGLRQISFGNSYAVKDIRSIQWHHYHSQEKGTYNIKVRYTSVIKNCYNCRTASKGRNLDYRYSTERYGLRIEKSQDVEDFAELYEKTFFRQNISLTDMTMRTVLGIVDLAIRKDFGKLYYATDGEGRRIDAIFVLTEHNKSYYIFGANDPDHRKKGGGTLLLMNELVNMQNNNICEFDFIGINSPNRGDWKLSFGGMINPYYLCTVNYH